MLRTLIREARLEKGLSQRQVAEQLGVSRTLIALWESGRLEPQMKYYKRLSEALGLSLSDLTEEIEEDNTLMVSYSMLSTFKRCRNKFKYRYIDKLEPKEKPIAPSKGSAIHAGLEHYFSNNYDKMGAIKIAEEKFKAALEDYPFPIEDEILNEIEETKNIISRWITYFEREMGGYFRSPDEKVVAVEKHFKYPLAKDIVFHGYFDLVINVPNEGLWIIDHKTTKHLDNLFDNLDLDEQMDYYLWVANKLFRKPVVGIIYNGISTKVPSKPKILKNGGISKAKIVTDYQTYYNTLVENGLNPKDYKEILDNLKQINPFFKVEMSFRTETEIENIGRDLAASIKEIILAKEHNLFTRTRSTGRCIWDCAYKNLCIAEYKGEDVTDLINEFFIKKEEKK